MPDRELRRSIACDSGGSEEFPEVPERDYWLDSSRPFGATRQRYTRAMSWFAPDELWSVAEENGFVFVEAYFVPEGTVM